MNEATYFIKPGYRARSAPQYFEDLSEEKEGIVYQPEVYPLARALGRALGCRRIIDLGCGRAAKLVACHPEFEVVGVDFGSNIEFCRRQHPALGKWVEWDLASSEPPPLTPAEVEGSIVVCADVIEHLLDPLPLLSTLRRLLEQAAVAIISTPERDLLQGPADLGPPVNPCHIREWNLAEFVALLCESGLRVDFAGLTSSNDFNGHKATSLVIAGHPQRRLPLFLETFLSAGPGAISAAGEKVLMKTTLSSPYQVLPGRSAPPSPSAGSDSPRPPEPASSVRHDRETRPSPLTRSLSPSEGERVPFRAGEGDSAISPTNLPPQAAKHRRIAIASYHVTTLQPGNGAGSPYIVLAEALAAAGHEVTLLDLDPSLSTSGAGAERFRQKGLRYVPLPALPFPLRGIPQMEKSYQTYQWLRGQDFEVVHFHEYQGGGYYSLLAKHQGLAFQNTLLCVGAQGPTAWRKENQSAFWVGVDELEADFMERESLRLADVVVCPSKQMLEWLRAQGWALPAACDVQPNLAPSALTAEGDSCRKSWAAWHEGCQAPSPAHTKLPAAGHAPRVSVCLCHYNRPMFLAQAIASLVAQDYPNFEVVLVDDGSDLPQAREYLDHLAPQFAQRGWQLLRQGNSYLGAARNTAARRARGEYLLFMDDDNVAKPAELSTFVRVAQRTGADILTAFMDLFSGSEAPTDGQLPGERYLFLGAAAAVGAFTNCFGDANMLVRRDVFLALGGFVEERDYAHQDWELLARAVLQGFHLEVVPEALFHYRVQPDSMVRTTQRYANLSGSLRPYLQAMPECLRPALMVAHGLMLELGAPLPPPPPPKRLEPTALNLKVRKMLSPKWRNSFRKRLATMHEWFAD